MKEIKVYGFSDARTRRLLEHLHEALNSHARGYRITEVSDVHAILDSSVRAIPAVEVNGEIVLEGSESSVEELRKLLRVAH